MSLITEIESFFTKTASAEAPIVSATTATALKAFGSSTAAQAVALLKQTDIGTAVANDVSAVESTGQTGAEKFAAVLANTVPLVLKYITGGGIAALESDVVGIASSLVQTVYTDVADTGFGKIGAELVDLLTGKKTA